MPFPAAGTALIAAVAVLRPAWTGQNDSAIFVLGVLGVGVAIAVRGGAVPFHGPAARLRTRATPLASALLLVWMPAGLGVLAISWSALAFHVGGEAMNAVVLLLQTIAVATLVLGAVGALVHDELEEVAAYSIVQDGAFVLLALTARGDAAAEPARLWLLDRLGEARGAEARYSQLLTTFVAATRLETAFWDMGWRAGL